MSTIKRTIILSVLLLSALSSYSCLRLPIPEESVPIVKPTWEFNPSWTLPVLEINTENGDSILSKETYIPGKCSFYSKEGAKEEEIGLQIRGRGNSSWKQFEKKPYKIKLNSKYQMANGGKSKHYVLLPFATSGLAYWDNLVGFELSRRIGLEWTPSMQPYELILNGDYQGLCFLTENIRIEKDRVNITQQENGENDPQNITGGWLLEIDNYVENNQIYLKDREDKTIRVTYHTPDSLSEAQKVYLEDYLNKVNETTQTQDINDDRWENYIDIDEMVKYYIVQELMDNPEAFAGSCWFHKDRGENAKIKFGPIWDLDACYYWRDYPQWITDFVVLGIRYKQRWLTEIIKHPHFQETIQKHWTSFQGLTEIRGFVEQKGEELLTAAELDHIRWPQYSETITKESMEMFLERYNGKVDFLQSNWNYPSKIQGVEVSKPHAVVASNRINFR